VLKVWEVQIPDLVVGDVPAGRIDQHTHTDTQTNISHTQLTYRVRVVGSTSQGVKTRPSALHASSPNVLPGEHMMLALPEQPAAATERDRGRGENAMSEIPLSAHRNTTQARARRRFVYSHAPASATAAQRNSSARIGAISVFGLPSCSRVLVGAPPFALFDVLCAGMPPRNRGMHARTHFYVVWVVVRNL
jgi:hypothetical protein